MNLNNHNYCVILAGGKGKRLWPESREGFPKQFLDIAGDGRTLLQQTFDRISKVIPVENIIVSTNERYKELVRAQIPELAADHILGEPVVRNTAPSLSWANHHITSHDPNARVVVLPSDQRIEKEDVFLSCILRGLDLVDKEDVVLTMGEKPTRPEPGYGYIQLGDRKGDNVYSVKSFTEKPDRSFATMFMNSDEFYWNTGIFIGSNRVLRETFQKQLPHILGDYDRKYGERNPEHEEEYVRENFPSYPNMSIDQLVLEKSDNVYVMICGFGWADLGTWHSIYEFMSKGTKENIVLDSEILADDSECNIIKLPKNKLGIINGLKDFIVIDTDDVLLICKKEDSSALIRKYLSELQIKSGEKYS